MKKIITYSIFCVFISLSLAGQMSKRTYKTFFDSDFKVGDIIISPEIFFDLSKCSVRPESRDSVKTIADFMKQHPTYKFEIGVHTDSRGNAEANKKNSTCRANDLRMYLYENFNIPLDVMTVNGYGESQPIINESQIKKIGNKTEEEMIEKERLHRKNRRVEIKIVGT